ncbi:hypothetical protein GWC95_01600 [Sediminibacterium roseum]|uniref:Outer membrane lipoprotein-sorting protein n=1 Tax=Sediminibacterium roseum TaxID=1978412 RepID=A0ABW9ZNE8_9BACT|nr:hypothetical protein [Sediminibacterium roseum]NCI48599.1 hypothetical protein [Sediminibacterium roseum]
MRTHVLIYLIVVSSYWNSAAAQSKKDTVFLMKNFTSEGNRHIIYIESNPKSWAYTKALEKDFDPETYNMFLKDAVEEYKAVPGKHKLPQFSKNWYPLYLYKGKYYVYYPSDNCVNNWVSINDSTVVLTAGCEGPYPAVIQQITMKEQNKLTMDLTDPIFGRVTMTIHLINLQRGIAIIESKLSSGEIKYQLVVDEKKFRSFPIIVNYNPKEKSHEFEFEPIDYQKLLRR